MLYNPSFGQIRQTLNLFEDYGAISQMVNCQLISGTEIQPVPYGRREKNPAIGVNFGNQIHSPEFTLNSDL